MRNLLRKIDDISRSAAFWQIMFLVMFGCFMVAYLNPRVVVQIEEKEIYLIFENESSEHPIVRTRAI